MNELPEHLKQFANYDDIWKLPDDNEVEERGFGYTREETQIWERLKPLLEPYNKLPEADKDTLRNYWEQKRKGKVVYKDLHENDILKLFDINKEYSVGDIAAKLDLDYVQAYRYIMPFLKGKGYKVGRTK